MSFKCNDQKRSAERSSASLCSSIYGVHLAWFEIELAVSVVSVKNMKNALSHELKRRFAIVGRNLAWILKGSQMVAGGLPARAHPRSGSHTMFSIPEEIADDIRGCRFAQPPATFYNPYRGNLAMMRDNEVIDLSRNAWGG